MEENMMKTISTTNSEEESNKTTAASYEEQHKIGLLRAFVGARYPLFKEEDILDELTLRRFLRARNKDVEKAGELLCNYLQWRRSFVPKGSISEEEIPNDIAQNKVFLQGYDKKGLPIVLVFVGRHFYHKQGGLDEFKRYVVYVLDKICARISVGHEKFYAIGDLQGWGYSNCDVRGYLAFLSILQDFYPERLGKLLILNASKMFMTVWKIIYPFIDANTREKIVFVDNKSLKSTFLQDVDEDQLPEIYGGKLALVPINQC